MSEVTDEQLAALADKLTNPDYSLPASTQGATGAAAAAQGRALLLQEYGSAEALDTVLRQAGRPRVGQGPRGASPTVRGRISDADYAAFKQLEDATGRSQSELVREAVHNLLTEHKLVS